MESHSQFSKKLKQVTYSLLGRVAQNTFTTGNKPFRIIPKTDFTFWVSYKNCLRGSKNITCCQVGRKVSGSGYSSQKGGQSLTDVYKRDLITPDSPRMNTHFKQQ
jgi:hypothetical protein